MAGDSYIDIAHPRMSRLRSTQQGSYIIPDTISVDVAPLSSHLLLEAHDQDQSPDPGRERLCHLCRRFLADVISGDATLCFETGNGASKDLPLHPIDGNVWKHETEDTS